MQRPQSILGHLGGRRQVRGLGPCTASCPSADLSNILEDAPQSKPPRGDVLGAPGRATLRMLRDHPSLHRRLLQDLGLAGLNDTLIPQQWNLPAVNTSGAWQMTQGQRACM